MDKKRSQHFNFTFESLPIMFHNQTDHFLEYLEKDGVQFLQFWWDQMGIRLDDEQASDIAGIAYEIREVPEKKSTMALITLPKPKNYGEVYMVGLVKTPKIRFPVRLSNTRVFALEYVPTNESSSGTFFGELTPRARYLRMGEGPNPDLDVFYKKVCATVWKK